MAVIACMSRRLGRAVQALALAGTLCATAAIASERPTPPTTPLPPAPDAAACDDRGARSVLLAEADQRISATFAAGLEVTTYGQNAARWRAERLRELARLSDAEAEALDAEIGQAATRSASGEEGVAATAAFIQATERFDEARQRNNDTQACRALVEALVSVHRLVAATDGQWRHISAAYDTEAGRRGLSLD